MNKNLNNIKNKKIVLNKINQHFISWDKSQNEMFDFVKNYEKIFLTGEDFNEEYNTTGRLPFTNYLNELKKISKKIESNGLIGSKIKNIEIDKISNHEIDKIIRELKKIKKDVIDSYVNSYKDPKGYKMFTHYEYEFNEFNWKEYLIKKPVIAEYFYNHKYNIKEILIFLESNFSFINRMEDVIDYYETWYKVNNRPRHNWTLNTYIENSTKAIIFVGRFIQYSIVTKIQLLTILRFYNLNQFNDKIIKWIETFNANYMDDTHDYLLSWISDAWSDIRKVMNHYDEKLKPHEYLPEYFEFIKTQSSEFYENNKENFSNALLLIEKLRNNFKGKDSNSPDLFDKGMYFVVEKAIKILKSINLNEKMNIENFNKLNQNINNAINDFNMLFSKLNIWIQDFKELHKIFWKIWKQIVEMDNKNIDVNFFDNHLGLEIMTDMLHYMSNGEFSDFATEIESEYCLHYIQNHLSKYFVDFRLNLLKLAKHMDIYVLKISIENFDNIKLKDLKLDDTDDSFDFDLYEEEKDDDHDCSEYHVRGTNLL